jgi:hypothetical protein
MACEDSDFGDDDEAIPAGGIDSGLGGTAANASPEERWSLGFIVGGLLLRRSSP